MSSLTGSLFLFDEMYTPFIWWQIELGAVVHLSPALYGQKLIGFEIGAEPAED